MGRCRSMRAGVLDRRGGVFRDRVQGGEAGNGLPRERRWSRRGHQHHPVGGFAAVGCRELAPCRARQAVADHDALSAHRSQTCPTLRSRLQGRLVGVGQLGAGDLSPRVRSRTASLDCQCPAGRRFSTPNRPRRLRSDIAHLTRLFLAGADGRGRPCCLEAKMQRCFRLPYGMPNEWMCPSLPLRR